MNVAIIGGGGREHALGWKIKQSPNCQKMIFIPGNGGTANLGANISCDLMNFESVHKLVIENEIDLVVIGPEQPLVDGLSDFLRENDVLVFGPSKSAAQIEASKFFAKNIMKLGNVPTAQFEIFSMKDEKNIFEYLSNCQYPCVIKADGLAAGKGVKVCPDVSEANKFIDELKNEIIGTANSEILIEEFMDGEETSIFAITDGDNFILLPAAQDHKRIGDGDTGDNTGGMGAYAPTALVDENLLQKISLDIIVPTLKAMRINGTPFSGCLYAGLMISNGNPKVVEFNCRFGDPETQVVLPILEGDFLQLLYSSAFGSLESNSVWYSSKSAVCVIAASNGYPRKFEKGFPIYGLEKLENSTVVFHSGTKTEHGALVTNGGRVFGLTTINHSNNLSINIAEVYEEIDKLKFENIYFRKDIGLKGLKYLKERE